MAIKLPKRPGTLTRYRKVQEMYNRLSAITDPTVKDRWGNPIRKHSDEWIEAKVGKELGFEPTSVADIMKLTLPK